MFTTRQRRGAAFVATCAAVTMAFSLASPALAATTDGDPIVLTPEQGEALAARATADVYDDAGRADPAAEAPADETDVVDGGNELQAVEPPTWKQTVHATVEGDGGMVQTAPLAGAGDDYLTIDALGLVQRRTAAGAEVWRRDNMSFYTDWGVKNARPWQIEPYPARIVIGYNAVSPFGATSESGFATGDLNGDGVDDLVFSAEVGSYPYRPMAGTPSTGTFVTILDGADGHTLWTRLYAGVYALDLVEGTLVLADSPSFNMNSPKGTTMSLHALRFTEDGAKLNATEAWTYTPDAPQRSGWADLEPVGHGLLAASWDRRKETLDTVISGHTLVIDTKSGAVKWETTTDGLYSRQLRFDASRQRIVAVEQSDVNDGVQYQVAAYPVADGARTVLDTRINAFPLSTAVGDLGDGGKSEIVVSESTVDSSIYFNASTVRALDGDSGAQRWSRTLKRAEGNGGDGVLGWGVVVAGGRVIANYRDDQGYDTALNRAASVSGRISVLAGNNGAVKWEHTGTAASPVWSEVVGTGKDLQIRTVDTQENIHLYNLGSGKEMGMSALRADSSTGVALDITGDGADDLIVGGKSAALTAYDGHALMVGKRVPVWTATLPGGVTDVAKGDVNGDGKAEVVVAADTATAVVDATSGKVLRTIAGGGQFVRTVDLSDVNGDGKAEIVVATDAVRVYGADGKLIWEYRPAADLVVGDLSFGDGQIYAEFASRGSFDKAPEDIYVRAVALDATTGKVRWQETPTVDPELPLDGLVHGATMRAATFASPEIPYADGHAVVYSWISRDSQTTAPRMFMEIRDGRTGEVIRSAALGGLHTLGGWIASSDGLMAISLGAVYTFRPDGDVETHTVADLNDAELVAGPNGERLLATATVGGVSTYRVSHLLNPDSTFISASTQTGNLSGRELMLGDFDGDGRQEAVSLTSDLRSADRAAELFGTGISQPFTAMRQFMIISFDAL